MVTSYPSALSVPDCATKVAVVAPDGTVTEAGTLTALTLLARAIVSAASAGPAKVTVQVTLELFFRVLPAATAQLNPERGTAGSTVIVAVCSRPFNVAAIVADVAFATDVVVAVNAPEFLPTAIIKVAGTVTCAELLARLIVAPPEPAFADRFTVHVLEPPPTTVAGAQLTEEIMIAGWSAGSTVRVAVCCTPFNVATIVAAVTLATDVVVAASVPVVLPAAIVKVAGTVACVELLARLIVAPPEPALADRVTVHVLEAPPTTVAGAQLTEEIVPFPPPLPPDPPTVIEPEVADSATGSPDGDTPPTPPIVT
ncbi:MAG TPA: hypothetical protein VIY49_03200 [Bryobacteraceae bacterium]